MFSTNRIGIEIVKTRFEIAQSISDNRQVIYIIFTQLFISSKQLTYRPIFIVWRQVQLGQTDQTHINWSTLIFHNCTYTTRFVYNNWIKNILRHMLSCLKFVMKTCQSNRLNLFYIKQIKQMLSTIDIFIRILLIRSVVAVG